MRRFISFFILILIYCFIFAREGAAQPFDLFIPEEQQEDHLSNELRRLQEVERDISVEHLSQPTRKLEALLELGELRLSQGKLEEAQRFFEMVQKIQPDNLRANQGLAFVYYHYGNFGKAKTLFDRLMQLYPLSDALKEKVERVKARLAQTAQLGLRIHEDSRGFSEIVSSAEAYFPSFRFPKLSARYRFENWAFDDGNNIANTRTIASTFEYSMNHRSRVALTYAPETLKQGEDVGGYLFHGVTGTNNLHLAAYSGKSAFKENPKTIEEALTEEYVTLTLFGEIHERTRISQSVTSSQISDSNARRRFDTDVLYFITRQGIPFLSLSLRLSQSDFEKQLKPNGRFFSYWTPSDHKMVEFKVSWERGVGSKWWWGLESQVVSSRFRDVNPKNQSEKGLGFLVHGSYRFESGRLYAEFSNTLKDYFRERMLGIFGSFDF